MSDSKPPPRPRQVTVAGGTSVVVCALLVVALFDAMAQVRSVETRNSIADFLSRPPGDGMGIGVEEAVRILRGVVLFNGALAAAAIVLAVFVLQRHNGARIGLSIAAALLLFTAPVSGGVLPVVLAAAATMLWSRPARDWFAGRSPEPVAADAPGATDGSRRVHPNQAWRPPTSTQSLPGQGGEPGAPPARPSESSPEQRPQPAPASYPYGAPPPAAAGPQAPRPFGNPGALGAPTGFHPAGPSPARRPATVTVAAWLTWVLSGLTAAAYLMFMVVLATARDVVLEAVRRSPELARVNLSTQQVVAGLWVVGVVVVFWSLAAMVLAFLAYRREQWARVTLVVSAAVAALVSLLALPLGAVYALAGIATVVLLFTGGASAWYSGRGTSQPPTYPGHPYQGHPYQGHPYQGHPYPGQYPGGVPQGPTYPTQQPGRPPQQGQQPGQPPQQGQQPGQSPQQPPPADRPRKNVW